MKGYKGFEKGLVCLGKQYAENTVFEENKAVICEKGMHFCENPFDVLDYYPIVDENGNFSDFAAVEALDEPKTEDNKKYCTTKLKIGEKLSFAGFVSACVDFVLGKTKVENYSGDYAQIGSSGDCAQIGSSGYCAQIGSSGNYAQIGSSGYCAKICSSGNGAQIGSSGNGAQIGSSGNGAQIGSSGNYAQIGSSGHGAQIGSSGHGAQIGSSGYCAQIGSSGNDSKICSSGYGAKICSSGYDSKICSSGEKSVICCAGNNCCVKAKKGSWITLSEWERDEDGNKYIPICVKTEFVDGERIKENTFYKMKNGEFVEVDNS